MKSKRKRYIYSFFMCVLYSHPDTSVNISRKITHQARTRTLSLSSKLYIYIYSHLLFADIRLTKNGTI